MSYLQTGVCTLIVEAEPSQLIYIVSTKFYICLHIYMYMPVYTVSHVISNNKACKIDICDLGILCYADTQEQ